MKKKKLRKLVARLQRDLAKLRATEKGWRTGRQLGRTLYRAGVCVGMVDTPALAEAIATAMNGRPDGR